MTYSDTWDGTRTLYFPRCDSTVLLVTEIWKKLNKFPHKCNSKQVFPVLRLLFLFFFHFITLHLTCVAQPLSFAYFHLPLCLNFWLTDLPHHCPSAHHCNGFHLEPVCVPKCKRHLSFIFILTSLYWTHRSLAQKLEILLAWSAVQHSQPVVISAAKPLHNWHHLVMSSQPEGSLSRISLSPGRRRRGVLLARRLGLLVLKPLSRHSVSHGWIWRAMTITSRGERKMNGLFFWIISLIFHLSHPLILLKSQVSTFIVHG